MRETTATQLHHVAAQFASRTVDATGWLDRTSPAQTPTANTARYGARRITIASSRQKPDIRQRIAAQYLMLVGK
jgi:hypothetical protein